MEMIATADEWVPFDGEYSAFAGAHSMLHLSATRWGAMYVRRVHGAALIERDAARRLTSGRWIAHRVRFAPTLFELLTRARVGGVNRIDEAA